MSKKCRSFFAGWMREHNKDRKNYPADQKMTDWLWEHPDVREKIWDMMKNEE